LNEVPQLLVEWSSPWQEFVSAVGPALRRSPPPLDAETQAGLFPWRGILLTLLVEIAAALATAIAHPVESTAMAAIQDSPRSHDIIFFSANELPRTRDLGGTPKGSEGRSGGASTRNAAQTIKVARGQSLHERVVDAPQLDLPKSDSAIKNLLAYKADVGPAPAEALSLARRSGSLQAIVAPPPPELQNEFRRPQLAQPQVVPPPVELSAQTSTRRNLEVTTNVVPPPVSAPAQAIDHHAQLTLPAEAVVAPRPDMNSPMRSRAEALGTQTNVAPPLVDVNQTRSRAVNGAFSGSQVVAPPPVELQNLARRAATSLGNAAVAPPPVDAGSRVQARMALPGSAAVAPPREANQGKSAEAPSQAKAQTSGVIVSPRPGDKPGQPQDPERAMLAMSPVGTSAGVGSAGGGSGAAHGSSPGSSSVGSGSGSSFSGAGKGSDATPRNGTSSFAGPGGAGDRYRGRVPGVAVSGGNDVVTLPSFGGPEPNSGGRSDIHKNTNGITVVASPRSGGAMNYYGALKGDRVYTIYFNTAVGMVSLQFADPESAIHPYTEDLIAPQALRTDITSDAPHSRLVLKCVLDRTGVLKNVSVLQPAGGEFEKQVLAALREWKFSPAFRATEPVEVNVILGFGIDTK